MKKIWFIAFYIIHNILLLASQGVTLVHNTYQEINAVEGKLELKLIRTWGGDKERDESKFFVLPSNIAIDKHRNVYISDRYNFRIHVFDWAGKHLRSMGQKGRGPGDLIGPGSIDFTSDGYLWVAELGGRRIQCFNTSGKSIKIFKHNKTPMWLGVTNANEIAVYSHSETFESRKLFSFYNDKGKLLRQIGQYHDSSKRLISAEKLNCSKDANDHFFVSNTRIPLIRKYSSQGNLIMVLTYETPSKIKVPVALNEKRNEIRGMTGKRDSSKRLNVNGNSIIIDQKSESNEKSKEKFGGCLALAADSKENLYIVAQRRHVTEEDNFGGVMSNFTNYNYVDRSKVNFDKAESTDLFRLLVFNPQGKVFAAAKLNTLCDSIYIKGNRIFIVDGIYNQRILEYKMEYEMKM